MIDCGLHQKSTGGKKVAGVGCSVNKIWLQWSCFQNATRIENRFRAGSAFCKVGFALGLLCPRMCQPLLWQRPLLAELACHSGGVVVFSFASSQ